MVALNSLHINLFKKPRDASNKILGENNKKYIKKLRNYYELAIREFSHLPIDLDTRTSDFSRVCSIITRISPAIFFTLKQ